MKPTSPVSTPETTPEAEAVTAPAVERLPVGWIGKLAIDEITVGDIALRPAQMQDPDFINMQHSMADPEIGQLQNITVRHDPLDPAKYMLVDGLQRLTIAQQLKWDYIDAKVVSASDAKVHSLQIQGNLHRVTTKPAQFGASIRRMMELNSDLTVVDIAEDLHVSTTYVQERINLKNLLPEIAERVDNGEITASAAFKLAKLPKEEQPGFVARAVSLKLEEFADQVEARKSDLDKAKRQGRQAGEEVFQANPVLRKRSEIISEFEKHDARATLVTEGMSAQEAFDLAVAWSLQMDPASVEVKREQWQSERDAAKKRAADREKARADAKAAKASSAEAAAAAATS